MTRDELSARVLELFPPLGEVEPWEWAETEEAEPVVCIEHHATFTGLGDGAVDLTTTIPNTTLIGIWRIGTDNRYTLVGLSEDPLAKAAEQAKFNEEIWVGSSGSVQSRGATVSGRGASQSRTRSDRSSVPST